MKAVEESEEGQEDSFDDDDDKKDEITHLAKRISKAWIKRKKKKGLVPKKDKKGKAKQSKIICFECKEPGHVRLECSRLKKSSKKKAPKKKAMMAIQEYLDEEQEGTKSQEEKEIIENLCFMADIILEEEIEVCDFEPKLSYDDLQKAYDELLDDSQILASHYAFLKKKFSKTVS